MDLLKKIFPVSFNFTDSVVNLVTGIIIYLVAGLVVTLVMNILGLIPLVGFLFGIVAWVVDIYCTVGIILLVLSYLNLLK